MGNVALCNFTQAILVVRLSNITPLYYDEALAPGNCMERRVGAWWFTIEVAPRIFDETDTTYENLGREAFKHPLDFTYTSEQFRDRCREFGWTPEPRDYDFRKDIYTMAGPQQCYRYCLKSPGWRLGSTDHKFRITGGPAATTFRNHIGQLRHNVSMGTSSPKQFILTKVY